MPLDSVGRYNPTHKAWDHVGNMIPVVEHSEGIRPHGEFKPAVWLPVQFFDKYYENWFVIMPGKILAFDNQGRVCPAQFADATVNVVYTVNDVDAGTIDVRTGTAVTAPASFAVSTVSDFMGTGEAMAVSKPVGVAPYVILQWAGDNSSLDDGFTPAAYRQHNYNMQHQVAVLCDYVLELPLVPATLSSAEALTEDSNADNVSTLNAVSNLPVAKNTQRTPITFSEGAGAPGDVATRFAVEKDSADDVLAAGDWHINLDTGVISVYSTGAIGATDYEIIYSHYAAAPVGTAVSKFACALGDLKAGDFVKCNADSNFVVATTEDFKDIMGQVIEVEDVFDKDALSKVRTAFDSIGTDASGALPAYAGQMDQMPGSATGGVGDKVHYAGAANLVVRINLISR